MKKIKDVNGDMLLLGSTKLREVRGSAEPDDPWEVRFTDLREASYESGVRLYPVQGDNEGKRHRSCVGSFDDGFKQYRIGCRVFDEKTFKLIMRAAKKRNK